MPSQVILQELQMHYYSYYLPEATKVDESKNQILIANFQTQITFITDSYSTKMRERTEFMRKIDEIDQLFS